MSEPTQTSETPFNFLFEATAEGIELQRQIDFARSTAKTAMTGALGSFRHSTPETPIDTLTATATEAVSLSATVEDLKDELLKKERVVGEHLAGMSLSIRVLEGEGHKLIRNTYSFNGGKQELGATERMQRKGMFRAALLGQNALVLYPQWLTGQQMDARNLVVPILREDGKPNIEIQEREKSWRDRIGHFARWRYDIAPKTDISRLRQLAEEQ